MGQVPIGSGENEPCPGNQIVGQLSEQDHHILGGQAPLIAPGQAKSLRTALVGGFHAAATPVITMQSRPSDLLGRGLSASGQTRQSEELVIGEGEDDPVIRPLTIVLTVTNRPLAGSALIGLETFDPANLPVLYFGVRIPSRDGATQFGRAFVMLDLDPTALSLKLELLVWLYSYIISITNSPS